MHMLFQHQNSSTFQKITDITVLITIIGTFSLFAISSEIENNQIHMNLYYHLLFFINHVSLDLFFFFQEIFYM